MISRSFYILDKMMTFFENWTLFIAVTIGLLSLFINVILRYLFNYSLAWSEELIREIIVYTTFIGCSAAIKNKSMITIDVLPQFFSGLKTPLMFVNLLATCIFGVLITVWGWKTAALQVATNQSTIILEIPLVFLYSILPLMGVMMFLRAIQLIYAQIKTMLPPGDNNSN